jgi:hypothetical protein
MGENISRVVLEARKFTEFGESVIDDIVLVDFF